MDEASRWLQQLREDNYRVYGARKLQSDDASERSDDRVVEVVVSADGAPFLIGQRVLVKFLKGTAVAAK